MPTINPKRGLIGEIPTEEELYRIEPKAPPPKPEPAPRKKPNQ